MIEQKKLAELEREKAGETLPELIAYLNNHPQRHTPFMDRWARLIIELGTQIYPVRREDGAAGKRVRHGKPARIIELIELIESCKQFGKPDVWFAKIVA